MRWLVTSLVTCAIGYLYPAYATYRAIERTKAKATGDVGGAAFRREAMVVGEQQTQWLMYWIVMSLFSVGELLAESLLFAGLWFPFYHECKVLFILWLTLPQFRGATQIYQRLLAPTLETYEQDIDDHLDRFKRRASAQVGKGVAEGLRQLRANSAQLLAMGQRMVTEATTAAEASAAGDDETEQGESDKGGKSL